MSLKKLFNLIAFMMVFTVFFMNNVQAKSSDESKKGNEQDTIILSKKDSDVKKYEADKLLFMTSNDDDNITLLFSDSPETVEEDGILYQDTVKGDARLLYYHVNGTEQDKKVAVVIKNMSDKPNKITITREAVGGPSADYLYVGKVTMQRYFGQQQTREINLPPYGKTLLRLEDGERIIQNEALVYGIFDFNAQEDLQVTVVFAPANVDLYDFAKSAKVLPRDQHMLRGTFEGADRYVTNRVPYNPEQGGKAYFYLGDNKTDLYKYGLDKTDFVQTQNFGNYGVNYKIHLNLEGNGKTSYYLKPIGGVYAGAMTVQVGKDGEKRLINTPENIPFYGHEEKKNYYSYLGTYNNNDDVFFEYTPPGASNLPVQIIIVPEK